MVKMIDVKIKKLKTIKRKFTDVFLELDEDKKKEDSH